VAEVNVYQFATQTMEGSWPTVCLGVNPQTCVRAYHNRHPQHHGCCGTQRMRNCDSRGKLSFRSDSTRDRRARKTTALEIEIKICERAACVRRRRAIVRRRRHSWYCGGRVGRDKQGKGPTDSSVRKDCEVRGHRNELEGQSVQIQKRGRERELLDESH
jgi:hypothetical protein